MIIGTQLDELTILSNYLPGGAKAPEKRGSPEPPIPYKQNNVITKIHRWKHRKNHHLQCCIHGCVKFQGETVSHNEKFP